MKKIVLSAAILLGSMTAFAQNETSKKAPTDPMTNQTVQEKFVEIAQSELPEAVKNALKKAYSGAVLEKAYVNENREYKLEIKNGNQKATVYTDANGNWINK